MTTTTDTKPHFNRAQIEIERFSQRLAEGSANQKRLYEYDITLRMREATGDGFVVNRMTLDVTAFQIESITQNEVVRLFLGAIVTAIGREKNGVRPGTP